MGIVMLLAVGATVPLLVSAQDATPGASPVAETDPVLARGEEIFNTVCIACHQPDGRGIEGIFLPLAGNPLVALDDPTYLITTILNGRGGMPRFDSTYSDEDIAAIATWVRQAWDNDASPVTAARSRKSGHSTGWSPRRPRKGRYPRARAAPPPRKPRRLPPRSREVGPSPTPHPVATDRPNNRW
jgi:mono/diheme cytochrome c family protein